MLPWQRTKSAASGSFCVESNQAISGSLSVAANVVLNNMDKAKAALSPFLTSENQDLKQNATQLMSFITNSQSQKPAGTGGMVRYVHVTGARILPKDPCRQGVGVITLLGDPRITASGTSRTVHVTLYHIVTIR